MARWLTAAAGVTFLLVGALFFIAPGYAAENFPWNVSPFVAMTIGAWTLGAAGIALDAARTWDVARSYAGLVFVWAFGLLELLVVIAFQGALRTDHWLTWPYLSALGLALAGGVFGLPALYRARGEIRRAGERIPMWVWFFITSFVVLVGLLAVSLFLRSGQESRQALFPEPLTLFTVRAFAAFFASLVLAAASLYLSRDVAAPIDLARVGLYLLIPITAATLLNLGAFDFSARPTGLIYIGAYVLTTVLALFSVWWYRSRTNATSA